MKPHERLYVDAVRFIEGGNDSLKDLVDHLLAESVLEEVAEEWGLDPGDVLLDILTKPGEYRVSEEHDLVIGTDVFLEGMTLTHRLTEDELHEDLLEATPDLILLFDNGDPALVSGGSLALRYPSKGDGQFRHGSVGGPPGWLDGFSAGDLVVFALGADGARVEEAGEVGDGAAEQAALLAEFESRAVGLPGTGFDATNIVDEAMLGHPDLFRSPVPPISELLDAAGLDLDGAWVGRPGDDWEPLHLRVSVLKARIDAERRGFSPCCVSELETAVGFAMGRNIPARDANAALSHGGTALAFQDWWMGLWSLAGDQFAELLVDLVGGGGELAGARYLAAIHHDARGEAVAAEGQLDRVLLDYPEYHPALDMAAGYASDRGDLRRAISLWTRADADPDEGSLPLHRDLEIPFPSVGRNDPCPCGSGRKYKVCHLDKPMVSDDRRVSWMFDKVFRYRSAHHRHDRVAALVADAMGDEIDDDEMIRLWGAEFVNDIAIFEDGLFEGFIAERSDLLPEDELAIFRLWVGERLRCWEVTATDGERWLTFRDTATDDTVEVHDRASASSMVPGDQILTRIFPAFGVHWLPPVGLRVDLRRRDEILELLDDYPPATVWIQWYQSLLAPPTLTTSEGDPFIYTTATLRPATNWDDLEPLLDATFERDGDTWTYLGHNEGPGSLIRGSLQREGDLLEIYTFSSERMDTILAMLDRHVVLVERTERAMAELEPTEGYQPEEVELSADDRAEIIEGMENKWLKESVPALGGLTPREAALDPTRREDLIALLRDFDRMTPPGSALTFDVDSLRRKLDLD